MLSYLEVQAILFTTDSAAALRAKELNAEIVIKGTKVDGVYNDDPVKNPSAIKYDFLSYDKVLENNLRVMDLTAITFVKKIIFQFKFLTLEKGTLKNLICGSKIGTLVSE